MREKQIEQKLVNEVKKCGGLCWKFTSPGTIGVPDRIILLPKGKIAFAELKAPGEKPRPIQLKRLDQLKNLGFKAYVIDSIDKIYLMIR